MLQLSPTLQLSLFQKRCSLATSELTMVLPQKSELGLKNVSKGWSAEGKEAKPPGCSIAVFSAWDYNREARRCHYHITDELKLKVRENIAGLPKVAHLVRFLQN